MHIFFIVLFVLVFLSLLSFVYAGFIGAPWVPTRKSDVKRVLELADIRDGEVFCDLGCGDGRLIYEVSKKGVTAFGYELSILLYLTSTLRRFFSSCRFKVYYKNFWSVNLSEVDVVYFFLTPKVYPELKKKLRKELKKGSRIIAYVWPFDDWKPLKVDKIKGSANLYLYKI
jgi:SAM-dependent methyltransferase